jgi:hypothetical protein
MLATKHSELRKGVAVNAASANAASGAFVNGRAGDACSETVSAKGATNRSNRGDESCEQGTTGVPEPARRLAASADKLNKIRAVNTLILAWTAPDESVR